MTLLEYIYHSSFLLSLEGKMNILFDFWKEEDAPSGMRSSRQPLPSFLEKLDRDLPLYVVISHHHKDHYNAAVFSWIERFPKIRYIVSKDVARFARHLITPIQQSVTVIGNGESFSDGDFEIKGFPSTDIGNSYALTLGVGPERRIRVFHAGDLNNWVWLDESTDSEIKKMQGDFSAALRDIKKDFDGFDIAMFPVDPRIGREYWRGAREFLRTFRVEHFFPMHFGLGTDPQESRRFEEGARDFRNYMNPERGEYIALQHQGDCWAIP